MGLFIYNVLHCIFNDINLRISPLDRPRTAEYTKGFPMKMSLINMDVNNSNNNDFFTNYSTNNRFVYTNDQLNSKTNHLIIN